MSKIKKNILLFSFSFLAVFSFIFSFSFFNNSGIAHATTETLTYNLSIVSSSKKISVQNSETLQTKTFDNFEQVFDYVQSEKADDENCIYLNFKNFNISNLENKQIVLNRENENYVFTGKIISNETEPALVLENVGTLELNNFEINSKNSEFSIDYKTACDLTLSGQITYNSKYFFKYVQGNYKSNYLKEDFSTTEKLNILLTYDNYSRIIFKFENMEKSKNFINICTDGDYYSIYYEFYKNGDTQELIASPLVYWNFESNGGTFGDTSLSYPSFSTNYYYSFKFPTDGEILKDYSNLVGWFGQIEYDEKTYYFDKIMLQNYTEQNANLSDIPNYFSTTLENLERQNAFTEFIFTPKNSQNQYEVNAHKYFFVNNKTIPNYIAKWELKTYDIEFNSNCDDVKNSYVSLTYNSDLFTPTLSRVGYEFLGWFTDPDGKTPFTLTKMPSENLKLYASWKINTYTISFETFEGSQISNQNYEFNQTISAPTNPTKFGFKFLGWYLDESFQDEYKFTFSNNSKMPAQSFTLYANWKKISLFVTFDLIYADATMSSDKYLKIDFFTKITEPENPICIGKDFQGWFLDSTCENEFNFDTEITSNTIIYAKWTNTIFTIEFVTNTDEQIESLQTTYGSSLSLPSNLTFKNHKFEGWYSDSALTQKYENSTAEARSFTLFAKWSEKETVSINSNPQSYEYGNNRSQFTNFSNLDNFYVYYLVDDTWTILYPLEIGSYDVKIIRLEDDTYASFEQIISNGFVINPTPMNLNWLIAIFYIVTFIEIAVAIFMRHMRRLKITNTYAIIIGTSFIPTSQVVGLIISGGLFVAGFVYMIYEIVLTHNTENNTNFKPSQKDNRERFKDELIFQTNTELDPEFEYKTKTNESFGEKYSTDDIEKMLVNDDYREKLQQEMLKNQSKNIGDKQDESSIDSENLAQSQIETNDENSDEPVFKNEFEKISYSISLEQNSENKKFENQFDNKTEDTIFYEDDNIISNLTVENFDNSEKSQNNSNDMDLSKMDNSELEKLIRGENNDNK